MAEAPMSEPGFQVDQERLASGAKEFDGLVERAAKIAAELDQALDGAAAAWGSDQVGQSFAAAHGGKAEEAAERLRGLAGGLSGVGESFTAAAAKYRAGESDATDTVTGTEG
ncbi:hypothetical protein [Amycolatopsis nigrescens]|uniref:hypothetical protein n=1 Tax=Amycolatopsis nigrescens TaxID=381445 RepID=UPI00036E8DEA|nr:hypothetical protein [Amycolatopsis nigrescens]